MSKLLQIYPELPVSLEEAKGHLRVMNTEFDSNISLLTKAAILSAESFTGLDFISRQYLLECEFSPVVVLDKVPVKGVTKVVLVGDSEEEITNQVTIEDNKLTIPDSLIGSSLKITFDTGYQETPEDVKAAILLTTGRLFSNPTDAVEKLPTTSKSLLRPYRRWE